MKKIVFLLLLIPIFVFGQLPQRKAFLGIQGKVHDKGILVDSVFVNSTFSKLKLKKGDVIVSINGGKTTMDNYSAVAGPIRTNEKVTVQYLRNDKLLSGK